MTRIESDIQVVGASSNDVYEFLSDLRNYEKLMPSMVKDFHATEKDADFDISGLGKIHVEIKDSISAKLIELIPSGKLPFQFNLAWELKDEGNSTKVTAVANADLNMFMRMMAEPQLKKFVQMQAETLSTHFKT